MANQYDEPVISIRSKALKTNTNICKHIDTFDLMLGQYCAPALAGLKPANLVCIKKSKVTLFENILDEYNANMNKSDIYFSIINETETGYLLLVYRKSKLAQYITSPDVTELIGLFLGYPPEDVIGFNEHKGKNYLISKYWKVYSNAEEAERMFKQYDKCITSLCNHLNNGTKIKDLFIKKVA